MASFYKNHHKNNSFSGSASGLGDGKSEVAKNSSGLTRAQIPNVIAAPPNLAKDWVLLVNEIQRGQVSRREGRAIWEPRATGPRPVWPPGGPELPAGSTD